MLLEVNLGIVLVVPLRGVGSWYLRYNRVQYCLSLEEVFEVKLGSGAARV